MVIYSAETFGWLYSRIDAKQDCFALNKANYLNDNYLVINRVSKQRADSLLFLQTGFSFVIACAILKDISGLEPSSEETAPGYLKFVTVPSYFPLILIITDPNNGKTLPFSLN